MKKKIPLLERIKNQKNSKTIGDKVKTAEKGKIINTIEEYKKILLDIYSNGNNTQKTSQRT